VPMQPVPEQAGVLAASPGPSPWKRVVPPWARGNVADSIYAAVLTGFGLMIPLIFLFIMIRVGGVAMPSIREFGWGFITSSEWNPVELRFGALPFIYGTVVSSVLALMIAVPLSVGLAIFLTELAPRWLAGPVGFATELLAAIPSVIYGLWGLWFFLPVVVRPILVRLNAWFGWFPLFEGPVFGVSYMAAGIVLAIMILPIITAITREVIAVNSAEVQHAAYALGATRWEVMRRVILPGSFSGIVGASMLGLGRALGETIAVLMLVGGSQRWGRSLLFAGDTLAAHIAATFQDASPEAIVGLMAIGVALFIITMTVNVFARVLVWRVGKITGDAAV
jgi:phosphate transport system permease protein